MLWILTLKLLPKNKNSFWICGTPTRLRRNKNRSNGNHRRNRRRRIAYCLFWFFVCNLIAIESVPDTARNVRKPNTVFENPSRGLATRLVETAAGPSMEPFRSGAVFATTAHSWPTSNQVCSSLSSSDPSTENRNGAVAISVREVLVEFRTNDRTKYVCLIVVGKLKTTAYLRKRSQNGFSDNGPSGKGSIAIITHEGRELLPSGRNITKIEFRKNSKIVQK